MPALDGTGPQGKGPLSGRGMGQCKGGMGRGIGRRMVRCCNRLDQEPTKQDLENYKNNLKKELEKVEKQIETV